MSDKVLTDEELSHNYGVGYDLMLKMGWTTHSKHSAPVFVSLDKNYNTDSKFGLGFVREENSKLDAEFEDMMTKMSSLTTKMPNSKAKSVSEGDFKAPHLHHIRFKSKQKTSSKSQNSPQSVLQKSGEKLLKSPNSKGFKANCDWNKVEDSAAAVSENSSVLPQPKISMKIKPKKVLKNNLSAFQ